MEEICTRSGGTSDNGILRSRGTVRKWTDGRTAKEEGGPLELGRVRRGMSNDGRIQDSENEDPTAGGETKLSAFTVVRRDP